MDNDRHLNLAELRLKMREGWREMRDAPLDCTWVDGLMADGSVQRVHYADSDGDGEQPPFRGWFVRAGRGFLGVDDPVLWRIVDAEREKADG